MSEVIPIFSSHYGTRSILTLDEASDKINDLAPVSIFTIAKLNNLKEIHIVDRNFGGIIRAHEESKKIGAQLKFGLKLTICANAQDQSEASLKTEHKIIIFIKNDQGYKDLIKIYNEMNTEKNFYYIPRLDYSILKGGWTDNLLLVIPFYDSFLYNNTLKMSLCVPDFPVEPVFCLENHGLPFEFLIEEAIKKQCAPEKIFRTHLIYYYRTKDVKAYQTYRIATNRGEFSKTSINKPQLEHFASDKFSWESYLELK